MNPRRGKLSRVQVHFVRNLLVQQLLESSLSLIITSELFELATFVAFVAGEAINVIGHMTLSTFTLELTHTNCLPTECIMSLSH